MRQKNIGLYKLINDIRMNFKMTLAKNNSVLAKAISNQKFYLQLKLEAIK
jgi:hypothetical protein